MLTIPFRRLYLRSNQLSLTTIRMVSSSSVKSGAGPSVPRPSASLIVVNDRNEILLVQRNPKSRSYAGAHVFPGGNFDENDGSHRVTAIRETFEETGLLLARSRLASGSEQSASRVLDQDMLNQSRQSILRGQTFSKFLDDSGLTPAVDELLPFTEWITPVQAPRRFHARFYVAFLHGSSLSGSFSHGSKEDFVPTPDGGQEVISARFVHPAEALRAHRKKEMMFMPPQYYLIDVLAEVLVWGRNTEVQRERVRLISEGAFGGMVVRPRQVRGGEGKVVLAFEGDEAVGGEVGARHRSVIVPGPGGVPTEVDLQRNIDVFETGGASTTKDTKL